MCRKLKLISKKKKLSSQLNECKKWERFSLLLFYLKKKTYKTLQDIVEIVRNNGKTGATNYFSRDWIKSLWELQLIK